MLLLLRIVAPSAQQELRHDSTPFDVCATTQSAIDAALQAHVRSCDFVVLSHRSFTSTGNGKLDGKKSRTVRESMVERYRQLHQLVMAKDARLLLLGDVQELPQRGSFCAASPPLASSCDVSLTITEARLMYERNAYEELVAAGEGKTFYLPLTRFFCDETSGKCGAYVPGTGTLAFHDQDHLMVEAALYLSPFLCDLLYEAGLR